MSESLTPEQPDVQTVAIVIERDGVARMLELADRVHVWAVETGVNRAAAELVWKRRRDSHQPLSMTVFLFDEKHTPEEVLVAELDAIDLHHDERSQVPSWSRAEVYGASANPDVRDHFRRLGFDAFEDTDTGFVAWRAARGDG